MIFCKTKLRHVLICMLAFIMMLAMIPSINVNAKGNDSEDISKPKVINVVFDDSGSMATSGKTRWCEAKYALEVFTAMLGEKDTLNIFQMSEYDPGGTKKVITIKGNDKNRVKTEVSQMNSKYGDTPIESIDAAASALDGVNGEQNDRWLVVLTDGTEFYQGGGSLGAATSSELQKRFDEYKYKFNVAYLGIGMKASDNPIKEDRANNLYSETAEDTNNDILVKVTEIARPIFEQLALPTQNVSGSYSLDIPTSQIIVFAQGGNVSIGEMKHDGSTLKGEQITVSVGEEDRPSNFQSAAVNTSLRGVVATYNAEEGSPFTKGVFDIDISGADKVEFYYKPGVKAVCILTDPAGNPAEAKNGTIVEGEYKADIGFIDPNTGEQIQSNLLVIEEGSSSALLTNNDKTFAVPGDVTIEKGTVKMEATVVLEGNVKIHNELEYTVGAEPMELSVKFDVPAANYKADELIGCAPIVATVIDNKTGQPITKEQWDALEVDKLTDNEKNDDVSWNYATKGQEVGTWNIYPEIKDNKVKKWQTGQVSFSITFKLKAEDETYKPEGSCSVIIEAPVVRTLAFKAEPVTEQWSVYNLDEFSGITVKAYMLNSETNAEEEIPAEVWEALKLSNSNSTKRTSWSVTKESQVGMITVKPGYMWGFLKLFTSHGLIGTDLYGKAEVGPVSYEGSTRVEMNVDKLTGKQIWELIWKYLLILAIALFFIIGYAKKKRINTKKMKPKVVLMGKAVNVKYKVKRKFIPYLPERAIVFCNKPNMMCQIPTLQIEARSKGTFRILNAEQVTKKKVRLGVNDVMETLTPQDKERIARTAYGYGGFSMSPVPPPGNKHVGKFYMSSSI